MRLRRIVLAVMVLGGVVGAPAASAAEPAVAERVDPAHSGSAAAPGPPLRLRWTRALEPEENSYPEISYPLVVGDRVFVVAARSLQALSAQTGATVWSVPLGRPARLAYDSGRLIVAATPWVKAFDAATGEEEWTRELENDDCAPVADGGVVYTKSTWFAYALRVSDGTTLWSRDLQRRSICQATVGPSLVYYGGEVTFALRRSDGTVAWTFDERSSSQPLALHGGRLWHAFTQYSPALDAETGALAGGAYTERPPAFAGDLAFVTVGYSEYDTGSRMLQAVDAATGAVRWEFGGEHGFWTTPTVAGGTVYVSDAVRGLYGLRGSDGRLQWCTTMPEFPDRYTHVVAGEGLLVVASGHSVTVYEPGGTPGCDYKNVARPHWSDPIEGTTARQAFESDQGQLPPGVRFAAAAAGHELHVTDGGARMSTAGGDLAIRPVGATGPRSTRGERRLPGLLNVIGARERHVGIRHFERVRQQDTWPGIDLVYRLSDTALEYDVVVRPGADLRRARIALEGASDLRVDASGALVARVGQATVRQAPPVAFQRHRQLPARFVLHGDGTVSFAVSGRDPARTLVIDPVLGVSGFLGGWLEDEITDIDLDTAGNLYVSGWTRSRDLAPFGWDEWNAMCAFDTCTDAFVAKYAPGGRSLVYLTLLSGANDDRAEAVAAGGSGAAYVAGDTESSDFPASGTGSTFAAKLTADGTALEWAARRGGYRDAAFDIAVDPAGSAYVAGHTYNRDFPTTPNAADRVCDTPAYEVCSEAWVAKYAATGALVYSTLFGGNYSAEWATGIAVDRAGRAVIAGQATGATDFPATPGAYDTQYESTLSETFVARLSATGGAVEWATLLGGFDWDDAWGLALDGQDRPVVVGTTESWDFPTTPGALDRTCTESGEEIACTNQSDGFVTKLTADGSALMWSTFLGGTGYDTAEAVDVDARGDVVVTGAASDEYDFPFMDAFQDDEANTAASCGSRSWCADAYFVRLSQDGALLAGTFVGGGSHDVGSGVAAEPDGDAWVAGLAHSRDVPASGDAVQPTQAGGNCGGGFFEFAECTDGFLAEIRASGAQPGTDPGTSPGTSTGSSSGTSTGASPDTAAGDVAGAAAPTQRRLTVRRRGRVLSGRLAGEACTARARVVLERRARGAWRAVRRARTNAAGRFRVRLPARRGTYRLRVPATAGCAPAYLITRSTAA